MDGDLGARLAALIARGGAIPLSHYIAYANQAYYAGRDPLGAEGDFTTAPEISQMFGEMLGLWVADLVLRAGVADFAIAELGPGRGTLMADMLRAMERHASPVRVHFIENSPVLRDLQAAAVPQAIFHDDVQHLPGDLPIILIANEFFDALPVRQLRRGENGWREVYVRLTDDGQFAPCDGDMPMDAALPAALRPAPVGAIVETCPAASAIASAIADIICRAGGALLAIDYGYAGARIGNSLQALSRHQFADPFVAPGSRDLTAHVDFGALGGALAGGGLRVQGPVGQGKFLRALGLAARANSLATAHPQRADAIGGEAHRLTHADEMGTLFQVLAARAPTWPAGEGFAA